MFALCDNMKWSHLPMAGGLYDQDPDFIAKMNYIFGQRNEHQRKEQEAQQAKMQHNKPAPIKPSRRPRRK